MLRSHPVDKTRVLTGAILDERLEAFEILKGVGHGLLEIGLVDDKLKVSREMMDTWQMRSVRRR